MDGRVSRVALVGDEDWHTAGSQTHVFLLLVVDAHTLRWWCVSMMVMWVSDQSAGQTSGVVGSDGVSMSLVILIKATRYWDDLCLTGIARFLTTPFGLHGKTAGIADGTAILMIWACALHPKDDGCVTTSTADLRACAHECQLRLVLPSHPRWIGHIASVDCCRHQCECECNSVPRHQIDLSNGVINGAASYRTDQPCRSMRIGVHRVGLDQRTVVSKTTKLRSSHRWSLSIKHHHVREPLLSLPCSGDGWWTDCLPELAQAPSHCIMV